MRYEGIGRVLAIAGSYGVRRYRVRYEVRYGIRYSAGIGNAKIYEGTGRGR